MFLFDSDSSPERSDYASADVSSVRASRAQSRRGRSSREDRTTRAEGLPSSLRSAKKLPTRLGRPSLNEQLSNLRDAADPPQALSGPETTASSARPTEVPAPEAKHLDPAPAAPIIAPLDTIEVLPADVLSRRRMRMPNRRPVYNPYQPKSINSARRPEPSEANPTGAVRTTGVVVTSRREAAQQRAKQRTVLLVSIAAIGIFGSISAGIAWMEHSDQQASQLDLTASSRTGSLQAAVAAPSGSAEALGGVVNAALHPSGTGAAELLAEAEKLGVTSYAPTPIFATYKDVNIYLPVSLVDLTEVGFHQANHAYAAQMETHLPILSISEASNGRGTSRDKAVQPSGGDQLLVGSCIEMWRTGRNTKQRTAVDAGAKEGSVTFAPVTGIVTKVTPYLYEGKFEDYEVHIQPDGLPGYSVVVIHIASVAVQEGDRVTGGATPIARIANIASVVRSQLATYAGAQGNHAHIQVNKDQ